MLFFSLGLAGGESEKDDTPRGRTFSPDHLTHINTMHIPLFFTPIGGRGAEGLPTPTDEIFLYTTKYINYSIFPWYSELYHVVESGFASRVRNNFYFFYVESKSMTFLLLYFLPGSWYRFGSSSGFLKQISKCTTKKYMIGKIPLEKSKK